MVMRIRTQQNIILMGFCKKNIPILTDNSAIRMCGITERSHFLINGGATERTIIKIYTINTTSREITCY